MLLKLGGARAAGLLVHTIVVHRPEDDVIRALAAEYRAYPVPTRSSDGELSDTLRTGIEVIANRESSQDPTALLICLADQPLLRLEVVRALIEAWRGGGLQAVRPAYREAPGEPGHPLLLDRSLWGYAAEMRGESGFGPVLARRSVGVRTIPVGGRNPDVDIPEDLNSLEEFATGIHQVMSPPDA